MQKQIPFQISSRTYDILVIGSGLAGLTAAFRAADAGASVLLCTSTRLCSGSSFYSHMDTLHCQCTIDKSDEEVFMEDIRNCSAHMNDAFLNRYYIRHIASCIQYLNRMGIPFHKLPEPKLACFASHPHDLYYWKDWKAIRHSMYQTIRQEKNIDLQEHTELIHIILDASSAAPRIGGACFYHKDTRNYEFISAKAVILATGGFGALYKHNLNSPDVSGNGHALALKVGASLINLEFNQFIPGFISPGYKIVFREGSLDYCEGLYDTQGNNVLQKQFSSVDEMKKCLRLRAAHGPFTTSDGSADFDFALLKASLSSPDNGVLIRYHDEILKDGRSYIKDYIRWLKETFHIDIVKDPITIAPFFHAANGGILVDHDCQTSIAGLFACGECAGGIHGADRLGGNASGSCLVFGTLAAHSAVRYCSNTDILSVTEQEIQRQMRSVCRAADTPAASAAASRSPSAVIAEVRELMWTHCNIVRTQNELDEVLHRLCALQSSYFPWELLTADTDVAPELIFQAENFLTLAQAIVSAMAERKESRGAHFRQDYPHQNRSFRKRIAVRIRHGSIETFDSPCRDNMPVL